MPANRRVALAAGVAVALCVTTFFATRDTDQSPESAPETLSEQLAAVAEVPEASISKETSEPQASESNSEPASKPATDAKPTGPGRIIGIAVLPGDAPKTSIRIILHRIDTKAPIVSYVDTLFATADTGLDGKFTFERLPLGTYMAYALAEKYTAQRSAVLTRSSLEGNLNLRMFAGGSISGRVVTADRKSVARANVFIGAWDVGGQKNFAPRERALSSRQTTDDTGAFTMPYLRMSTGTEPGYRIAANADGYTTTLTDYIKAGTTGVEIVLSEGVVLNGSIESAESGEPVPDKTVQIESQLPIDTRSATADAEGFFFIPNVSAGLQTASFVGEEEFVVTRDSAMFTVPKDVESAEVTLRAVKGAIVSGRVYDAGSGNGIGDVSVAISAEREIAGDAKTAADGTYRLTGLQPVKSHIYFESPKGYSEADGADPGRTIVLAAGAVLENVDMAFSRGLSVRGIVLDDTGAPIPQVGISAYEDPGGSKQGDPTDDQGAFVISGFKKDRKMHLYVGKEGFAPVSAAPDLLNDFKLTESLTGVRVTMVPESTVSGTTMDSNGVPIKSAWVVAYTANEEREATGSAHSDEHGAITIKRLPPGEYEFIFGDETGRSSPTSEDIKPVKLKVARGEKVTGVRFVQPAVEGLTISGRVYDSRGNAVSGAWVRAGRGQSSEATDATGAYTVIGLPPGTHELSASSNAFASSEHVKAEAGATGVDLRLKEHAKIEGRVVSARTGQPVVIFSLDSTSPPTRIQDPDGKFTLEKNDLGTKVINVSAEGFSPGAVVVPDLIEGEVRRGIVVRLESGITLTGTVKDSSGRPVNAAGVRLRGKGGGVYYLRDAYTSTGADGSFQIPSLPAGTLTLTAFKKGYPPDNREITLTPGGQNRVDIVFTSGGSVTGIVTMNGKPLEDAHVNAEVEPGNGSATTDSTGRYLIEHVSAGSGTISASKNTKSNTGSYHRTGNLTVTEGRVTEVNLELSGGTASVEGTVYASPGKPLRGSPYVSVVSPENTVYGALDSDGNFFFEGLPSGAAQIVLRQDNGFSGKSAPVQLVEGQKVRRDMVLSEGTTLRVDVLGVSTDRNVRTDASLFAGVEVFDSMEDWNNNRKLNQRITSSDIEGGRVEFAALDPGTYTVLVSEYDYVKSQLGQDGRGRWTTVVIEVGSEPEQTIQIDL